MAFAKVLVSCFLFVAVAVARPQATLDENGEMFDPNPQYTYSYQVSADDQQTYLAHEENRNGEDVTGKYSYVDPLGSLITVTYTSGIMGYTENRDVKENFVAIRSQPASSGFASSAISSSGAANGGGAIRQVVQQVQPVSIRQETISTSSSSSSSDDGDLVARIISQLTPYIQETVSSSLSGGRTSTVTTTSQQQAARPISVISSTTQQQEAPVIRTVVAQPVQTVAVAAPARQASSSVEGIFGVQGQNNVRVETPNFNFAYDLTK